MAPECESNLQERAHAPVHPRNKLNDLDAREWVRLTRSWFVADGRPADITAAIDLHPASFPPDLVARFLRFFTKEGERVLDPFVGTGSVLAAAFDLGRKGIGIELNEVYFRNALERIEGFKPRPPAKSHKPELFLGDARELDRFVLEPVQFCICSPPYWDMLKKSRGNNESVARKRKARGLPVDYGDDPRDIGTIDGYQEYLDTIRLVFEKVKRRLDRDRYLVVVVQNIRPPEGEMRPLAWDLARELQQDWVLQQEFIWCQNQKQLGCWGYPSTYVSNVHHHYCLVFKNSR